MVKRQTGPMGAGAVGRNVATYFFSALLFYLSWLNHITAAFTLILGFTAETVIVVFGPRLLHSIFGRKADALVSSQEVS